MKILPPGISEHLDSRKTYLATLGVTATTDDNLLLTAFVHKSYANDFTHLDCTHNERLEFLWDSVLGSVVSRWLFEQFPDQEESMLTLYKISLVREESLAAAARLVNLQDQVFLGKGEENSGWRDKDVVLADAFEALLGFLFVDKGYEFVREFILSHLIPSFDTASHIPIKSYKTTIQEYSQQHFQELPLYNTIIHEIDDKKNPLSFESTISINKGKQKGVAVAASKKKAQELAAKDLCEKLSLT